MQKTLNVYATATLSGDVANALALLKRMTLPALRKQKSGLLIPAKELACCHVRLLNLTQSPAHCLDAEAAHVSHQGSDACCD